MRLLSYSRTQNLGLVLQGLLVAAICLVVYVSLTSILSRINRVVNRDQPLLESVLHLQDVYLDRSITVA